jgi:hypothetical protein
MTFSGTPKFDCLVYSPVSLADPGVAVAACRAGGLGILDFEYAGAGLDRARANWERLIGAVSRASS